MIQLNLINPQASDISYKTLIFPDGQPHIVLDLGKNAQNTEGANPSVIECSKIRNVKTGQLSGFNTQTLDFQGKTCFIIDDICDGGGTFVGLAALLKSRNARKIVLIVSHGIFSKGFDLANIDAIYTTDSFKDFGELPNHVTVLNFGF